MPLADGAARGKLATQDSAQGPAYSHLLALERGAGRLTQVSVLRSRRTHAHSNPIRRGR